MQKRLHLLLGAALFSVIGYVGFLMKDGKVPSERDETESVQEPIGNRNRFMDNRAAMGQKAARHAAESARINPGVLPGRAASLRAEERLELRMLKLEKMPRMRVAMEMLLSCPSSEAPVGEGRPPGRATTAVAREEVAALSSSILPGRS